MTPTTPIDPLAQLRGLHLPDPIGFWPPAPGWWIVAGLVVVAAAAIVVLVRRRRRSLARIALREIERLAAADPDLQQTATALAEVLRRVALCRFDPNRVAALHGEGWQRFLVETGPPPRCGRPAIEPGVGLVLAMAPYFPPGSTAVRFEDGTVDRDGLVRAVRRWIRWNA